MILAHMLRLLVSLIPRFETNNWAVIRRDDGSVDVVKTIEHVQPGEVYDGIVTVSDFTWFGLCVGGGYEVDLQPWVNPHDKGTA